MAKEKKPMNIDVFGGEIGDIKERAIEDRLPRTTVLISERSTKSFKS